MRAPATWLFALFLLVASTAPVCADNPPAAVVKCTLTLSPEIDCPSYEDRLKHILTTAHGVRSTDIDVLTNRIVVCYDPASINVQALIGRIAVMGYTAKEIR